MSASENLFETHTAPVRMMRELATEGDRRTTAASLARRKARDERTAAIAAYSGLDESTATRKGVALGLFFDGESTQVMQSFLGFAKQRRYIGSTALQSLRAPGQQQWQGIGYELPYIDTPSPVYLCSDGNVRGLYADGVATRGHIPQQPYNITRPTKFRTARRERWVRTGSEYYYIPGDDMGGEYDVDIQPHEVVGTVIRTYTNPSTKDVLLTYAREMEASGPGVTLLSERLGDLCLAQHTATELKSIQPEFTTNAPRFEINDSAARAMLSPGNIVGSRI
ncbi:MAG TPA: hypothetical protein VLA92_04910 [Candidatus Saccharimonadales bacterium]|nr:hypothetical protein [Candidatus Saccharimonadales bacterium]